MSFGDFVGQAADLSADVVLLVEMSARSWSSLRISVSAFTFSITAGLPDAMVLISA
jgi:hypothetical protein